MKKIQHAVFALIIGAAICLSAAGCSQLRRIERDIIKNIPGVERIDWTIRGEAIGAANMECTGTGGTLADALDGIECRRRRPDGEIDEGPKP